MSITCSQRQEETHVGQHRVTLKSIWTPPKDGVKNTPSIQQLQAGVGVRIHLYCFSNSDQWEGGISKKDMLIIILWFSINKFTVNSF